MTSRPPISAKTDIAQLKALDLFCWQGGATKGLQRAGYKTCGVDIRRSARYCGDWFIEGDALSLPIDFIRQVDFVWASPPCQAYLDLAAKDGRHPKLIEPTRELLHRAGVPYAIENSPRAPLLKPVQLCGSMFGLNVRRHRAFETSFPVTAPKCNHKIQGDEIRAYYGKPGWLVWTRGGAQVQAKGRKPLLRGSVDQAPADMGIGWMDWDGLREAVPPAYSEFIARAFLAQRKSEAA